MYEKYYVFIFLYLFLIECSLLPNTLRPFQIYCAPSNLGMTRTWICLLNFALSSTFLDLRFFKSLKFQIRDPQLKVPPGGLWLRIFPSWKNPSTSAGFEPANFGSRGEHITPRPPRPTSKILPVTLISAKAFWFNVNHSQLFCQMCKYVSLGNVLLSCLILSSKCSRFIKFPYL